MKDISIEVEASSGGYNVKVWSKDNSPKLLSTTFCKNKREVNRLQKQLAKELEKEEKYVILEELHGSYMEFVIFDSYDDSEVAKGSIKWDNCSNWEVYQAHFCELEDMQEFHKAVEKCYEIASQKIENWLTDEIVRSW